MASAAEIGNALDRLVAAAHRQRAAAAATLSHINATDMYALDIVRRHPDIGPGALAREMQLTAGGTNGVIRRVIRTRMLVRRASRKDRRDVRLEVTHRGEALMTTGVGGWDPRLLERLARLDGRAATDMMELLTTVAEVAEQRAGRFADKAETLNSPGVGLPRPAQWG